MPTATPANYAKQTYNISPYQMGLMAQREIPEKYMIGAIEQRLELLSGLLFRSKIYHSQEVYYTTQSLTLLKQVYDLCHSLNIPVTILNSNSLLINRVSREEMLHHRLIRILDINLLSEYANMTCFEVDSNNRLFYVETGEK